MDPADVTAFGGKPKGLRAHLKMRRGFGQVEPLDIPVLWRTVNGDLVVRPQCRHALSCPTVAVTGRELVAIEDASNQVIRGDPDQQPNRLRQCLARWRSVDRADAEADAIRYERRRPNEPAG
jgi:hypothetical protein